MSYSMGMADIKFLNEIKRKSIPVIYEWEMEEIKDWTTEELKNRIWMEVECNSSIPGCVSVEAMRQELINRGEEPAGYHNT